MRNIISIILIVLALVFIIGFGMPNIVKSFTELQSEPQQSGIKILYGFIQIAIAGYFGITELQRFKKVD